MFPFQLTNLQNLLTMKSGDILQNTKHHYNSILDLYAALALHHISQSGQVDSDGFSCSKDIILCPLFMFALREMKIKRNLYGSHKWRCIVAFLQTFFHPFSSDPAQLFFFFVASLVCHEKEIPNLRLKKKTNSKSRMRLRIFFICRNKVEKSGTKIGFRGSFRWDVVQKKKMLWKCWHHCTQLNGNGKEQCVCLLFALCVSVWSHIRRLWRPQQVPWNVTNWRLMGFRSGCEFNC